MYVLNWDKGWASLQLAITIVNSTILYDSVGNKAMYFIANHAMRMGEYLFICYYDAQQACDASLKKIFHNDYGVVLHKDLLID